MPAGPNLTCHKLGGRTKKVGFLIMTGTAACLWYSHQLVPYLPRALPACVTWWLGMLFMKETVLDILLQHVHKFDVFIVTAMANVMILVGFIEGLAVGFMLSMI